MSVERKFISKGASAVEHATALHLEEEADRLAARLLAHDDYGEVWRVHGPFHDYIVRLAAPSVEAVFRHQAFLQGVAFEPKAIDLVREKTSIPAPEVYVYLPYCEYLESSFTLSEFFPGRHLGDLTPSMINEGHMNLSSSLGVAFRELHAIKGTYFGLEGGVRGVHDRWSSALAVYWNGYLEEFYQREMISKSGFEDLLRVFDEMGPALDVIREPSLLHGNVHGDNWILDEDARLVGFVDWVDSFWGDPLWDLVRISQKNSLGVGFSLAYPEGRERLDDVEAKLRLRFYTICFNLRGMARVGAALKSDAVQVILAYLLNA